MEPTPPSPLKQSTSRPSLYGQQEQAGRSSTALHAHASSASIALSTTSSEGRAERPRSSRPTSFGSQSPDGGSIAPVATASPSESAASASHSDLSTSSEAAQTTSSEEGSSKSRRGPAAFGGANNAAAVAAAARLPMPPRRPGAIRTEMSSRRSSASLARIGTPRSMRELGSDYTRYFNPFTSANSSTTDLQSLQHGHQPDVAQQVPLLGAIEKRHSNPFEDQKQVPTTLSEKNAGDKQTNVMVRPAGLGLAGGSSYRDIDPEKSFFPYLDDRLGAPGTDSVGYTFPMMWDEKEDDDDMHMPMVDDDIKMKANWRDRFSRENICSIIGFIMMFIGMLLLFIILPVLSSTGLNLIDYTYETPLDEFPNPQGAPWAHVNNRTYPLLKNLRTGLIDPDTPQEAMTKTSLVDGSTLNLVFSDEFNDENRTFYDGDDPFWFGFDGWYGATQDLEYYDPDAISTSGGVLTLQLDKFENHNLQYRSGMLNSWNKMCFKGGIWEVSVSLPGPPGVHALWPGIWSMGNLGRPGYLATTDGLWPYTYNSCDAGITPNQSMSDGTSHLPGQRLPSCTCPNSDHPTPGTGRGAPEIDIIEVAADYGNHGWATATQSFQVAPFDIWYYPNYEYFSTPDYSLSYVNSYVGGPYQQAVSTTTVLNNDWFDGKAYQRYSYEYSPGSDKNAYISWAVGDQIMAGFDARAVGPNGNIGQRLISEEPMSMILNLAISNAWTTIDYGPLYFPTVMRVDYVRIYQREGEESVTCDPPGYETTEYIANHPEAYNNPNYTKWSDIPGYSVPKNTLMHGC